MTIFGFNGVTQRGAVVGGEDPINLGSCVPNTCYQGVEGIFVGQYHDLYQASAPPIPISYQ
jgi:hypothetical protein